MDRAPYQDLEKLTLTIDGFSSLSSDAEITAFEGAWTAVGGAIRLSTSTATEGNDAWYKYALNGYGEVMELLGDKYLSSYVNFDMTTGQLGDGSDPSRTVAGEAPLYGSFESNWFSTGSFVGVGDTLAVMYVTPGANVSFVGGMTIHGAGGTIVPCNLNTIPEPGTLALLGCGLLGLLCHAWRKRR